MSRAKNEITVQCDAKGCGWSVNEVVDAASKWHNAPCPKCGHAPVLSDGDMDAVNGIIFARDAGLISVGGRKPKQPHLDVKFDTSGLRSPSTTTKRHNGDSGEAGGTQ